MDDILSSLGGLEGDEYESLNFDNDFRGNQKPKCDIDTCVSLKTGELQEWCANNAKKTYSEWGGDVRKEFNTWTYKYIKFLTHSLMM